MTRAYIGFATSLHDPALAIVGPDGGVRFAEATERYLQSKRGWNAVPDDIGRIGAQVGEYAADADEIVVATSWSDRRLRMVPLIQGAMGVKGWLPRMGATPFVDDFLDTALRQIFYRAPSAGESGMNLDYRLMEGGFSGPRVALRRTSFDHHRCHAQAAAWASPWDDAVVAVVDGMGEDASTAFFRWQDGELSRVGRRPVLNLASLGYFYAHLTWACGFDPVRGEEWKVMGLAATAEPDPDQVTALRALVRVDGLGLSRGRGFKEGLARLFSARSRMDTPEDAAPLAAAGQQVFAEVMTELLHNLASQVDSRRLILTGGCALNSAFNGQIVERTPFERVYVPSAPGDDGNALGAAWLAWAADHPGERPAVERPLPPGLGTPVGVDVLARVERFGTLTGERVDDPADRVATLLAEGAIVGVMRGRAEWGPRALGHRSILADPRRPDIQAVLNDRVKFREGFRPFAPAILHEYGPDWFEAYQYTPYMERALRWRPEVRDRVPGVVHANGTGRLQSVTAGHTPFFHAMLSAFYEKTGVPVVVNTSFNVMGKPIIHGVEDAVATFCTTGLDALLVEDWLCVSGSWAPRPLKQS